ncbi:MAG: GNAT family N-acetyltransferase [Deltaproteobacteria bacterium]|nr:GNAT family N-acetyltransferase [Deltaproteobacteria bacterium]
MKLEEINYKNYLISNNKSLLSLEIIHEFLSRSYWASQRSKETIAQSIQNSECFGIYTNNDQVGFARIVTDYSVMYWLCDVFIDENHRKKGLGKKLIETIVNHEEFNNLIGMLATLDAHPLYEKYGFVKDSERFMRRRIN